MLETKCIGDKYKKLMTVLVILLTNIYYLFTLAPTFKRWHHYRNSVTNFRSPTSRCRQHHYHLFIRIPEIYASIAGQEIVSIEPARVESPVRAQFRTRFVQKVTSSQFRNF